MSKKQFPDLNQTAPYMQINRGDDIGSIWSSFNLDFQTKLGAMLLSPKLVTNVSSDTETAMKVPVGFEVFSDKWYCVTGMDSINGIVMKTNILSSQDPTQTFTQDLIGMSVGSSTTQFDVTNPSGTTFRYTYDGTGTNPNINTSTFPVGAVVNIINTNMVSGNEGQFTITASGVNYFEITNASGVVELNKTIGSGYVSISGGTVSNVFSLGSDIKSFNNYLWVSGDSTLFRKDGDTKPFVSFDTYGGYIHQMQYLDKFDRLYYVANNDEIRSVGTDSVIADSGDSYSLLTAGEEEVGIIYCMYATTNSIWIGLGRRAASSNSTGTSGLIYEWDGISAQPTNVYQIETGACLALTEHEGIMYAVDSEGRILKQTGYSFSEIARLPIERYLLRYYSNSSLLFINFNGFVGTKNNTLLLNIANKIWRTDLTSFENLPGGIWELDLNTNSLTHKASLSYKNKTSSSITDYGQFMQNAPGAIKTISLQAVSSTWDSGRSSYITGGQTYKDATNTVYSINIDSPEMPVTNYEGQKRGYFVTTWFNSDEIEDKWSRLWTIYKRFTTSTDKIIAKYRLYEEDPIYANITWVNTTSFTTTTDITAYAPNATGFNGTVGGEVEIVQGTGGGACVHITNVVNNAGTYTVTIDNAVTGVTGTAKARFQKWIKLNPEITGQVKSYEQMAILANNTRIQIKIVMEWTGNGEFTKFILTSNEDIKATL